MLDQATRPIIRLAASGGQATSHHDRAMVMAPGHAVIVASQGKLLLDHSPRDPAGCNARVVRDFRRHSQEGRGHRGKEVHVSVPRTREIILTGGRDGAQPAATKANRRTNSETYRDNVCVKVATFAAKLDATQASIERVQIPLRYHQPWDVSSVDREVAIPPATRRMLSHRLLMLRASQRDQFQHLL